MQEITPTWLHITSIWWLFAWRGTLGGFLIGLVLGFIWGFIAAMIGVQDSGVVGTLLGGIGGLIWSLFVVRMALRKKFKGFRLTLVPLTQDASA